MNTRIAEGSKKNLSPSFQDDGDALHRAQKSEWNWQGDIKPDISTVSSPSDHGLITFAWEISRTSSSAVAATEGQPNLSLDRYRDSAWTKFCISRCHTICAMYQRQFHWMLGFLRNPRRSMLTWIMQARPLGLRWFGHDPIRSEANLTFWQIRSSRRLELMFDAGKLQWRDVIDDLYRRRIDKNQQ